MLRSCAHLESTGEPGQLEQLEPIDLAALVLQPDDFPPQTLAGTHLTEINLDSFFVLQRTIATRYLRSIDEADGAIRGGIFVTVFLDAADARAEYDLELRTMSISETIDFPPQSLALGEYAVVQTNERATVLRFGRCHAYVYLTLKAPKETLIAYARRLDTRLKPVVCLEATPSPPPARP